MDVKYGHYDCQLLIFPIIKYWERLVVQCSIVSLTYGVEEKNIELREIPEVPLLTS